MVEKDAVSRDFRKQVLGYGLTTSFIVVRIGAGCCKLTSGRTTICSGFPLKESSRSGKQTSKARCLRSPSRTPTDQACRTTRRGRSLPAALTRTLFFVSGFGSGAYSAKLLNGTRHRFSGFSHPRQCGEEVLRTLVTGGPPVRGGGVIPSASMPSCARRQHCGSRARDGLETHQASAAGCRCSG